MRVLIQRVSKASVTIQDKLFSEIGKGLLVLVGIEEADTEEDINWICNKVVNLRIFNDEKEVMNLSLMDTNSELMVVSQFTLQASTKKGNRPSYLNAAKPNFSIPMYEKFVQELSAVTNNEVKTGKFGTDMQVELLNDGPVTIWIDSKSRT